jgi:unsaturated chondroitin disaccharide hydrolase
VAGAAAGAGGSSAGAGGDNQAGASGALGAGGAVSISHAADAAFCSAAFDSAAADYKGFLAANTDPTKVPRSASGSVVTKVDITDWTSGFIAGNLWLLYEHSKDEAYKTAAAAWTAALYSARLRTDTHDVGFIIMSSYGNGYRITQNADYATVIKQAGVSLATRFSAKVGATRSWDDPAYSYPVIIDNMMNLELLYRATTLGGSATLAADAVQHALTTKTNHFRPDFSSYHLVDYDPSTGAVIKKETVQGISDDSAWARGQTWGLYGFTMGYRESKDQRFLDQALAIAEFYTKHADFPSDNVPFFDFSTVQRTDVPDYRDSSAGAVAAGGLLELANYATPEAAERYRAFAIKALRSLASPSYRAPAGSNGNFLLLHSVGNYPANTEIDVALNYADYYYLEALGRCAALK